MSLTESANQNYFSVPWVIPPLGHPSPGSSLRSESDSYHRESINLCYDRWASGFRVLVEWEDTQMPEAERKPWAECRREDKLLTLPKLLGLIEAIENEINSRVEEARKAIAEIKKLTSVTTKAGEQNATK